MRIATARNVRIDEKWIGVDLDGTLAEYDEWRGDTHVGAPIPKMVERVKEWLKAGKQVKIFTARAHNMSPQAKRAIDHFSHVNFGRVLPITNEKDPLMEELWDDKAVRVKENTGEVASLARALKREYAATNPASVDAINETKKAIDNTSGKIAKLRSDKKQLTQRTTKKTDPEYVKRSADFTKRIADTTIDRANSKQKLKHLQGDKKRRMSIRSAVEESMPIKKGSNFSDTKFQFAVRNLKIAMRKYDKVNMGTQDGLTLRYLKDQYATNCFYLQDEFLKVIGLMEVTKGKVVINVFVSSKYRGRNLGTVLYLAAIHKLGSLRSSYDIGTLAVRTWKSVSKYHTVSLINEKNKPVTFTWGEDSIPVVNGTPITKLPDQFYFFVK